MSKNKSNKVEETKNFDGAKLKESEKTEKLKLELDGHYQK